MTSPIVGVEFFFLSYFFKEKVGEPVGHNPNRPHPPWTVRKRSFYLLIVLSSFISFAIAKPIFLPPSESSFNP